MYLNSLFFALHCIFRQKFLNVTFLLAHIIFTIQKVDVYSSPENALGEILLGKVEEIYTSDFLNLLTRLRGGKGQMDFDF